MPKQRSPDRDKAKEIYIQHKGKIPLNEIANQLSISEGTVRGWKAKDVWDNEMNGTFQSDINKNTERSKQDMERSDKNKKKSSIKNTDKAISTSKEDNTQKKTDSKTPSPYTRFGNKNAVGNKGGKGGPVGNKHAEGNKGGHGGPIRNKKALKTGEYETVFFSGDILNEDERALLDTDYDKYIMQYLLIDAFTVREKRIFQRIKEAENTPGGMVFESVTKSKGTLITEFKKKENKNETEEEHGDDNSDGKIESNKNNMFQSNDNSSHVAKPVIKRVMELEDALTRVQARKQAAIAQLHRMEMDDEQLSMNKKRLKIYKQRISGRLDIDTLFENDIELDEED